MFMEVEAQHNTPHFHAYYQGHMSVFGIESVDLLAGDLPRRQRRLVEAWAELHQQELINDWAELQHGRAPIGIEPLR